MQLALILGIVFSIISVVFALQNNVPVTVSLAIWRFEGSLALVLLIALGLGALIAGLISSPAMIRRQWTVARMGRQVTELEAKAADLEKSNAAMAAQLAERVTPVAPVTPVDLVPPGSAPISKLEAMAPAHRGPEVN